MIGLAVRLRAWRVRLGLAWLIVALAFLVAWAHNGPAVDHMEVDEVVAVCLAVLETVAVVLTLGSFAETCRRSRWPAARKMPAPPGAAAPAVGSLARDGPALLQVFRD